MDRAKFDKLWFTGNVRILVDDKKALTLAGIGVWIMTKAQFALSPVEIGFSWWGAVLFVLASGIPFLMINSAAQAVKNRIIREPEIYALAQELEVFGLEEYE
jgi:hypothetical protein